MQNQKIWNFILIDDSNFDCMIVEMHVKSLKLFGKVQSFYRASDGIAYITNNGANVPSTILLVDIQMPQMNGYQFLSLFEQLPTEVKEKYHVYMISSKHDGSDTHSVNKFTCVKQVISKPITEKTFDQIAVSMSEVCT